tara:strand:+ start:107 stop:1258 length:1152 start_codon:yes stop_codon:yes gene_type:complete
MRRLGWKFWLVVVLILGAMAFSSLTSGDERDLVLIQEMIVRVDARASTPVQRQSAVYGQLLDGDALPHYRAAEEAMKQVAAQDAAEMQSLIAETRPVIRVGETQPAIGGQPVADGQPAIGIELAIAAMQLGAHSRSVACAELKVEADWLAVVQRACANLLAEGRDVAAVEIWLDALVMCTDGKDPPDNVEPFVEQWTDDRLTLLEADARERLRTGLLWFEEKFARPVDWEGILYPHAHLACRGKLFSSTGWLDQLMAWDSGFSPQRKAIKAMGTCLRSLKLLSPIAKQWSDRSRQFTAFETAMDQAAGGSSGSQILRYREIWRRQSLAHLRLLRAAIEIHEGRTPDAIMDPLGDGPITVLKAGGTWTLSSGSGVLLRSRTVKK